MAEDNVLFFAVLPQISLSPESEGRTEEVLTLLPDRSFATEFFPDQVDDYIRVFKRGQASLTGGHVENYECVKETTDDERIVVRVMQRVR